MGSLLSGRRNGQPSSDDCVSLKLPDLRRRGLLKRGHIATWRRHWLDADGSELEFVITADLRECQPRPRLLIACASLQVSQAITLEAMAQPLGGERWFALCPRSGARCLALYLAPGEHEFASLRGLGLLHGSQREQPRWRVLRALDRARERKAGLSRYARRPTRGRIEGQLREVEMRAHALAAEFAEVGD